MAIEIVHVYSKMRREFGRPATFTDTPVDWLWETYLNPDMKEEYLEKKTCNLGVQAIPEMSEHEINTKKFELKGVITLHLEGGWPKDVDCSEAEQTIRFKKKVEKDADFIASVRNLGESLEHLLKQNTSIDIYEDYFAGTVVDHSSEAPSAKTLTIFRDPNNPKRTATSISWYPDGAKRLAVSYSVLQFQRQPEGMSMTSYVWDLNNPNFPEMEILPASPLCVIEYNPKDPHILVGGCYNGLLAFWDARRGSSPVESSPIEKSHRDPMYDVAWLQSKTGTECASVSTDGQIFWWDLRKLVEPTETLLLDTRGDGSVLGGVTLSYNVAAGPSKFLVGTEQGSVLLANRKAKTPADRIGGVYSGHHGPIYALQRHPFFTKYFMTIGDWTARIWMEDLKSPIMTTKYHSSYLTDGEWSPTRPGVFFTTKMDGTLDIWDYFYKQNDPAFSLQVADIPLHCLSVYSTPQGGEANGRLVATGAVDGSTTLFEISDGLVVPAAGEKQSISQMFERETKREKNLDTRAKELRQKEKREGASGKSRTDFHEEEEEERLKDIERQFFEMVAQDGDSNAAAGETIQAEQTGVPEPASAE